MRSTLSRIPTQFVSAVLSPLLAHLSESVERADEDDFRRTLARAEELTVALGVGYVVAFAALGQLALAILLGPDYTLGVANLAVLAAASSGMFVAVVQQAALGALGQWDRIAWAWVAADGHLRGGAAAARRPAVAGHGRAPGGRAHRAGDDVGPRP